MTGELFEANEVYTVNEIAERMRVHPNTVREWLTTGELEGVNYGGRAGWRVMGRVLNEFHRGRLDATYQYAIRIKPRNLPAFERRFASKAEADAALEAARAILASGETYVVPGYAQTTIAVGPLESVEPLYDDEKNRAGER